MGKITPDSELVSKCNKGGISGAKYCRNILEVTPILRRKIVHKSISNYFHQNFTILGKKNSHCNFISIL